MSRLTVRLPQVLHTQLDALARSEGVSLNQYIVYALTRQATLDQARHDARPTAPRIHQALDSQQALNGEPAPPGTAAAPHHPDDFPPPLRPQG